MINLSSLAGNSCTVKNSRISKNEEFRVRSDNAIERRLSNLPLVLRSNLSIKVRVLYAAYCYLAASNLDERDFVVETIQEYPEINFTTVSKLRTKAVTSLQSFGNEIASCYFGCTQAEKKYLNEIITYIVLKDHRHSRIFTKCLTASELKAICS